MSWCRHWTTVGSKTGGCLPSLPAYITYIVWYIVSLHCKKWVSFYVHVTFCLFCFGFLFAFCVAILKSSSLVLWNPQKTRKCNVYFWLEHFSFEIIKVTQGLEVDLYSLAASGKHLQVSAKVFTCPSQNGFHPPLKAMLSGFFACVQGNDNFPQGKY